jgi:hypothetical protein
MTANELTSFGYALDLSPQAFGELRRSADIAHDDLQLRARMAEDGYLYLPGLLDVGGLMVLEHSHRQADKLQPYLQRDVDAYCTNYPDAGLIASGQKQWQDWDGRLSSNPVTLREKLGGRWLTADFQAGDLLTFGMATVHASLDNQSNRLRLSSDSRYQLASEPADERWIGANPIAHGPDGKKGKVC